MNSSEPFVAPLQFLLVDDEPRILSTLERGLVSLGHRVQCSSRPADALRLCSRVPDCVVVDYYMPEISGVELLKQVAVAFPTALRVILTGGLENDSMRQALSDGTVHLLVRKPFSRAALQGLVDRVRQDGVASNPASALAASPKTDRDTGLAGRMALQGTRVVLVDDDRFFLETTSAQLAKLGCRCLALPGAADLATRVRDFEAELVLIDLLLDGESGVDAIDELRLSLPDMPVLAVTGSQERAHVIAAIRAGARGVLHKPLATPQIEAALRCSAQLRVLFREELGRPTMAALVELQFAVAARQSEPELLDLLLQLLIRLTRADCGLVLLAERGGDGLLPQAHYGFGDGEQLAAHLEKGQEVGRRAVEGNKPVNLSCPPTPEGPGSVCPASSILGLPLRGRDSVLGAVCLGRIDRPKPFSSDDLDGGLLLANEASLALERLWLEDRVQEAERMAMQRDKLVTIGELASGVAHEINNPLGYISSNLRTLEEYFLELLPVLELLRDPARASDPAQLAALLKKIDLEYLVSDLPQCLTETQGGVQRVLKIVADLKTMARDDTESKEAADLNALLDGAVNILWSQIKHKAELVRDYGELPAFWCHPSQLGQVFINLLGNAAQAIERQGRITLRTRPEDGCILIEVNDNGCGMEPRVQARIFEPFFTTKPRGVGTGLGLPIVRKIVERHNGTIAVSSQGGQGTTFRIRLPLNEPDPPEVRDDPDV